MAANVEPENVARRRLGLVRREGELDPPCLATPAGEHLRLDDNGATELSSRGPCLLGSLRQASLGNGDTETREELLALVFVEIQAAAEPTSSLFLGRRIAGTRSRGFLRRKPLKSGRFASSAVALSPTAL